MGAIVAHQRLWLIQDRKYILYDFVKSHIGNGTTAVVWNCHKKLFQFIPVTRLNELEKQGKLTAWDAAESTDKVTYLKYVGHEQNL